MSDVGVWQVRAAAWELLALSLRYPDEVLGEAIASGEWEAAAAEIAEALGIGEGEE
ncbi:molecular chaperone TorD, partial [Eggerthella sinensis]